MRNSSLAPVIEGVGPVVFDVGARGGLDEDLVSAAWGCTIVGFEPEAEEARKLAADPDPRWRRVMIVPSAIGPVAGEAKLHLPARLQGASLRPHNAELVELYGHENLHRTVRTVAVQTITLDQAHAEAGLPYLDYLKLDIEGAELDVLRAGQAALKTCSAMKVEVSFLPQRKGQALADEVIAFARDQGFMLADIRDLIHWRRRPVQPHPLVLRHPMPYSRGVAAQADLIFLREPSSLQGEEQALRLIVTAALLGYFDFAVSVLRQWPGLSASAGGEGGHDLERALAEASRSIGRHAAGKALRSSLREAASLARSLIGGLPADRSPLPY